MSLTADYSTASKIDAKNNALADFFKAKPNSMTQAAQAFVDAAEAIFGAFPAGQGNTMSLKLNCDDLRMQTGTILIATRHVPEAREIVRPLAQRLGLHA